MVTAIVAALVLGGVARVASADRVKDLSWTVTHDKDEKARIAAAVGLGKLADPRAVPALIKALEDDSPVVRGVAASALGHIGDERALEPLEKLLGDPIEGVRKRARDALLAIRQKQAKDGQGAAPLEDDKRQVTPKESPRLDSPGAPRVFVVVKSGANKTTTGGADMGARLKRLLESALGDSPEVTLDAKTASANRLDGFIIDGSIVTMKKTTGTKWVELRCEVKLSISNSQGKMLSIVSGGATVQVPKGSWKSTDEAKLWLTALENAVRGAHQNLVSYMTEQMASN